MNPRLFGQVAVPAAVVSIVLMLVVPLPAVLLDLLLAANIAGSLLILLMSMFVRRPLDFAIFPALLLIATMFRLALNVSSTRLVLLDGYAGAGLRSGAGLQFPGRVERRGHLQHR